MAVLAAPLQYMVLTPLLLAVLALSYLWQHARYRRVRHRELVWHGGHWYLETGRDRQGAGCTFEFISPLLVAARVEARDERAGFRLVFTADDCGAEAWRRLHIRARGQRASGVADNNVLGGEVDRHEDGVAGNR